MSDLGMVLLIVGGLIAVLFWPMGEPGDFEGWDDDKEAQGG